MLQEHVHAMDEMTEDKRILAIRMHRMTEAVFGKAEEHDGGKHDHDGEQPVDFLEQYPDEQHGHRAERMTKRRTELDADAILPTGVLMHEIAHEDREIDGRLKIDREADEYVRPAHDECDVVVRKVIQDVYLAVYKSDHAGAGEKGE